MRKERTILKRELSIFIAVILLLGVAFSYSLSNGYAATTLPTKSVAKGGAASSSFSANKGLYSSWENKADGFTVDSKYGFYPIATDKTIITPFGERSDAAHTYMEGVYGDTMPGNIGKDHVLGFDAHKSKKGGIGWKGTNFKIYNPETGKYDYLDATITLTDWTAIDTPAYMFLGYDNGLKPKFNMWGVLEANMKMSFYKAGTDQPYTLNSHFTFDDIDAKQYLGFQTEGIVNQYVSTTSKLNYSVANNMNVYHYPILENDKTGSPDFAVGATYSADSLSIMFGNAHLYDQGRNGTWAHFGFYAGSMAPIEPPTPVKSVSDADENNQESNTLTNSKEEFTYSVKQHVPDGYMEASYYKNFIMKDELEPVLDVKEAKVLSEDGRDVSSLFEIKIDWNKVTATAKNTNDSSFYNQIYSLEITSKIKEGADISKYTKDETVAIPNKATVIINDNPQVSNQVVTKYVNPNLKIQKDVQRKEWKVGEMVKYTVTVNQTVENATATDVVIKDLSLPEHLAYNKDSVKISGIPEGQYEIVKEGNGWILKTPTLEYGQEIKIIFEAKAMKESAGQETVNIATVESTENKPVEDDAIITVEKETLAKVASKDTKDTPKATKTGDSMNYLFWIAALLVAGLATVMTVVKARK